MRLAHTEKLKSLYIKESLMSDKIKVNKKEAIKMASQLKS